MTKKYCDRCKREIVLEKGQADIELTMKIRVTFEKVEKIDLCPRCGAELREWLGETT